MTPIRNRAGSQAGLAAMPTLIILGLVAALVLVFSLYVVEKSRHYQGAQAGIGSGGSETQYNWRLVTSWPKNFPGLGLGPENFAKLVERMSQGRLKIQVYGAGELVPALGVFDAVSTGSAEMGHTAAYYHKGKLPASPFYTAIPFGMNVMEQNAWLAYGDGLALWRELYEPFNVLPFQGGNTGMQMGGWFNKEIKQLDDIKGLKMRIPGIAGEVFNRAGGSGEAIPGGEIYTSMQTGLIDATEWVGPYNDRAFGLHEVGKYYYYPGWQEPSAMLEFDVNIDAWNSLPADLQAIVEAAALAINQDMLNEYTARSAAALEGLERDHGIVPQPFPKQVLRDLNAIAQAYYIEESEKDASFKKIYASYRQFQERTSKWTEISEREIYRYRQYLKGAE